MKIFHNDKIIVAILITIVALNMYSTFQQLFPPPPPGKTLYIKALVDEVVRGQELPYAYQIDKNRVCPGEVAGWLYSVGGPKRDVHLFTIPTRSPVTNGPSEEKTWKVEIPADVEPGTYQYGTVVRYFCSAEDGGNYPPLHSPTTQTFTVLP